MPEDTEDTQLSFPKDFLWGASTSSHQMEGGNHNQWTVWELAHAAEQAKSAPRRLGHLPIWPQIKTQAQNPNNYVSGRGIDHFNRYEEDFDLAKKLNLNAFRFCIEWSRVEPAEGEWDDAAIAHYKRYIAELRSRGLEPMVNLWHFSLPVWFSDKGGFLKRSNVKYFERYVHKMGEEVLDGIQYIITINEPNVYTTLGYLAPDPLNGWWPPGHKSLLNFSRVYWNLVKAHRQAYYLLKHQEPNRQIAIAAQLANIQAKHPHNELDALVTRWMRYFWNWWFLRRIRKEQDYVGFNYYFTDYYTGAGKKDSPVKPVNDLGWYMEPEGLFPLLLSIWNRYKKPIIVTENGVADRGDEYRRWWIEESIVSMERAISEGVDVRGYFHWSLLDNFEWAAGWWPKFGLVAVDRQRGMKRTVRGSALWFAKRIKKLS